MKKYSKPELSKIKLTADHQVLRPCKEENGGTGCYRIADGVWCPAKESYGSS